MVSGLAVLLTIWAAPALLVAVPTHVTRAVGLAGRGQAREFLRANVGWLLATLLRAFGWPLNLYRWLAAGRPPCPWIAVRECGGRQVRAIVRTDLLEDDPKLRRENRSAGFLPVGATRRAHHA
jgi:hypothetical protein